VIWFAGRDQLETPADTHDLGIPTTDQQLERRVVAGLAELARTRSATANDSPVHDDLERAAAPRGAPVPAAPATPALDVGMSWDELKAQVGGQPAAPAKTEEVSYSTGAEGRLSELEERELNQRWAELTIGRSLRPTAARTLTPTLRWPSRRRSAELQRRGKTKPAGSSAVGFACRGVARGAWVASAIQLLSVTMAEEHEKADGIGSRLRERSPAA